jgi:hypothetical protein
VLEMDKIWANLSEDLLEQIIYLVVLIQMCKAHGAFKIIYHTEHRNTPDFIPKKGIVWAAKIALPAKDPHFVTTLPHR